jgi:hypothetical protein
MIKGVPKGLLFWVTGFTSGFSFISKKTLAFYKEGLIVMVKFSHYPLHGPFQVPGPSQGERFSIGPSSISMQLPTLPPIDSHDEIQPEPKEILQRRVKEGQ